MAESRRRAEIEAKRAKLAELRRAREERSNALSQSKRELAEAGTSTAPGSPFVRKDVDDLVESLVGPRTGSPAPSSSAPLPLSASQALGDGFPSSPATPSLAAGGFSDAGSERGSLGTTLVPGGTDVSHFMDSGSGFRSASDLVSVDQELFELPQRERVVYNKEVQTTSTSTETEDDLPRADEAELRARIQREEAERLRAEAERDRAMAEEEAKLEREIEQEIRELTEEERAAVYLAPEFSDFIEHSSKIVQRALSDGYDYTRDYRIGADSAVDDSEGKTIKLVCAFSDEKWTKNRSITDVDWSPTYPELSVASYNKNPSGLNEPDGIVAVWNLHLLERPEFVFHSQSDVLSITFSPFHSNLVFGGTYSGQILLWDTRAKHLPVLKTPLSAAGHTHPVYAMQIVGTQNAHNLITTSTDGMVCSWLLDMLAQPQETLELTRTGHSTKTDEVAITSLGFPDNETTTFWVGTEEGHVFQGNRYDRAGTKAGLNHADVYAGHAGPVTGLHFHPGVGPVDFSDMFLTSSVDWSVKLWRAKGTTAAAAAAAAAGTATKAPTGPLPVLPLHSFDEATDYVYDVKWHPAHPAVFGSVDGAGEFHLWNLNVDTEVPVATTSPSPRAINKLAWDRKDGRRAALGSSDGSLYVYDVGEAAVPRPEVEWEELQRTLAGMMGRATGAEAVGR